MSSNEKNEISMKKKEELTTARILPISSLYGRNSRPVQTEACTDERIRAE